MTLTKKNLLRIRRTVQAASAGLLIVIIWNTRYPLEGFINPEFYFKIDPLVMIVTYLAERVLLPGLLFAAGTILVTLVLGRAFCGWICPLGALMDFWVQVKTFVLKRLKKRYREPQPTRFRFIKYGILSLIGGAALFGLQFAWSLDPITIFVRTFSYNIHPAVNASIDGLFRLLIEASGYALPLERAYNFLREGFLSISTPEFSHTGVILGMFLFILLIVLVQRRLWCRYICPLGALLALPARYSPFKRVVRSCRDNCSVCMHDCRMNAIRKNNSYLKEECVLCLDCITVCPNQNATFTFKKEESAARKSKTAQNDATAPAAMKEKDPAINRKQFVLFTAGILASLRAPGFGREDPYGRAKQQPVSEKGPGLKRPREIIRPPGALPEDEFIQRCIRCGNCMKVCPTNVLQPSSTEGGISGIWTPRLDPWRGYCEYTCTLCGQVCPTDALGELTVEEKKKEIIGTAKIFEDLCIPYVKGENCIVCEEHCPVPEKAIKLETRRHEKTGAMVKFPVIDVDLCIGCIICENKCPTEPEKAVVVYRPEKN